MRRVSNKGGEFDAGWRYGLEGQLKSSTFDSHFDDRHEVKCGFQAGNTLWCRGDSDHKRHDHERCRPAGRVTANLIMHN